jgi:hypothetical protein
MADDRRVTGTRMNAVHTSCCASHLGHRGTSRCAMSVACAVGSLQPLHSTKSHRVRRNAVLGWMRWVECNTHVPSRPPQDQALPMLCALLRRDLCQSRDISRVHVVICSNMREASAW